MEHVTQAVANQNPPRHSDWFMRRQGIGLANQHKYPHATGLVPGGHVTGQVDGQRSRVGGAISKRVSLIAPDLRILAWSL